MGANMGGSKKLISGAVHNLIWGGAESLIGLELAECAYQKVVKICLSLLPSSETVSARPPNAHFLHEF